MTLLSNEEVLSGYNVVNRLYPYIPSMTMWRACEYAAYQKFKLSEPVLDIGCGDGRYFNLVWPDIRIVVGVDIESHIVQAARESGVYREVIETAADNLPFEDGAFASAFANCSLEHMDNLPGVLQDISRVLLPDALFLLSVTTDKFESWASLPLLIESVGMVERAQELRNEYLSFHHLISSFTPERWAGCLNEAGFEILAYIPIVPELLGRLFLFIDNLWHIDHGQFEIGHFLQQYLTALPKFPLAFGKIIEACLSAEKNPHSCCGAVFSVRKRTLLK
jgi:SAM-dependent methyltransferase